MSRLLSTVDWETSGVEPGTFGKATRRLFDLFGIEDILGFELIGMRTKHRLTLDDDDLVDVSFKLQEGPPLVAAVSLMMMEDVSNAGGGSRTSANAPILFGSRAGFAEANIGMWSMSSRQLDFGISVTAMLGNVLKLSKVKTDIVSQDFSAHVNGTLGKGAMAVEFHQVWCSGDTTKVNVHLDWTFRACRLIWTSW